MAVEPQQMGQQGYSVVVATLGGPTLPATVACLQASGWAPSEILICIPAAEQHRADNVQGMSGVRIVPTGVRGQVAQRAAGFAEADCELVLQCDDDVHFDPAVPGLLRDALLALGRRNVVGPVFCHPVSGAPVARHATGLRGLVANLYFWLIAGLPWGKRRMGRFSATTCAISVDPAHAAAPVVACDWLAGGFVLGWRDELVRTDFYPFRGKAYCEDLLHARERAALGVKHHVVVGARVLTEPNPHTPGIAELKREFAARYRISRRFGASVVAAVAFLGAEGLRRLLGVRA
jgi:hypothetical protein